MLPLRRPIFFAKKGWWGEHGYIKISFLKYLLLRGEYVTKIKWIKCKTK